MKKLSLYFRLLSFVLLTVGSIQSMEPERSPYATRKLPPIPTQSSTPNNPQVPDIITIELNDVENDLSNNQWVEIVNNITARLQNLYHPNITFESIEQFRKDVLNQNTRSIKKLKDALKNNFGIGHIAIMRDKVDNYQLTKALPRGSKNTQCYRRYNSNTQERIGYLYDPNQTNLENIKNYLDAKNKISLKIIPADNGINVPIIAVPSFNASNLNILLSQLTKMADIIQRKYDYLILDLRGNNGGDIGIAYYFLSLFLGNNDPDVYPITLNNNQKLSYENLNKYLSTKTLPPFYQYAAFDSVNVTKNTTESITFKKMVVLVDEYTFSSGEIVAATLKNTLGEKVCILGKPCSGSLEDRNDFPIQLPYDFKLYLSGENMVFYSKKLKKLLTGCRLLPDIEYDDMSTIKEKALDILFNETPCSANGSYERTVK